MTKFDSIDRKTISSKSLKHIDEGRNRGTKVAAGLFYFCVIGLLLEYSIGRNFAASYAAHFYKALPFIFSFVIPLCGIFMIRSQKIRIAMATKFPTLFLRWGLVFPLTLLVFSSLLIFSPLGWTALFGWGIGTPSVLINARIVEIKPRHYRERLLSCKQEAVLEIGGQRFDLCLDGRVNNNFPKNGDTLILSGKRSPLGFYINEIRT